MTFVIINPFGIVYDSFIAEQSTGDVGIRDPSVDFLGLSCWRNAPLNFGDPWRRCSESVIGSKEIVVESSALAVHVSKLAWNPVSCSRSRSDKAFRRVVE